jgi:hypothetical protein
MFREKTVFVLGAGSNLEHGFLLGSELKAEIKKIVGVTNTSGIRPEGNKFILSLLNYASGRTFWGLSDAEVHRAAAALHRGIETKPSIDEFLDLHSQDLTLVRLAKLAILWVILRREASSDLFVPPSRVTGSPVQGVKVSWLAYLWHHLTKGIRKNDVERLFDKPLNDVTFVTFNYDRSLEQYLFRMLQETYLLDEVGAGKIVERADIRHVYGSVGEWSPPFVTPKVGSRPFGDTGGMGLPLAGAEQQLVQGASGISTYTEEISSEHVAGIRVAVGAARQLYFLGTGYHTQNLDLLTPSANLDAHTIAGTGIGLVPRFCEAISRRLHDQVKVPSALNGGVIVADRNCEEIFKEFAHRMESHSNVAR